MKNINLLALIFLVTVVCSSCVREIKCDFAPFMAVPPGYTAKLIGTIPSSSLYHLEFQMIDENIGYVHNFRSSEIEIYKTTDGGATWNELTVESDKWVHDMLFVDENNGYISQQGDSLDASMMITTDGGLTWMEREYPDISPFRQMLNDQYGNLYGVDNYTKQITKSTDGGLSWTVIMTPLSVVHNAEIQGDKIYLVEGFNKIKVTDLEGNFIKLMGSPGRVDDQLMVIDSLNIIVGQRKTSDGGQTWKSIFPTTSYDKVTLIGFSNPGNAIIIRDKDYCDIFQVSITSSTMDGGQTWSDSEEMNNFAATFNGAHKLGEDHYLVLSGNEIYELKR